MPRDWHGSPRTQPRDKGMDTSCFAIKQKCASLFVTIVGLGRLRASLVHVARFVVSTSRSCPAILAV